MLTESWQEDVSNRLLVEMLTQPHLQSAENTIARSSPCTSKCSLSLSNISVVGRPQSEAAADVNTIALQKELHEQRMVQLRRLIQDMEEDNWQYEPMVKMIGPR